MAIAKMEKIALSFKTEYLDEVLQLMQGFQGIHIETGFESTIPPSKKTEIDKEIAETEKNLQEIHAAHSVLKGRQSMNILSLLKDNEEKKFSISELVKIVEESNWEEILEEVIQTDRWLQDNRTRRQEVIRLFGKLKIWGPLNCNPLDFKKLQRTTALFGSVHKKHAEGFSESLARHEDNGICYEIVTEDEDRVYFLVLCHISMNERLNSYINVFSFSIEEYPFDKPQEDAKKELEKEETRLLEDEKEIDRLIAEQQKYEEILEFADDYNLNFILRKKKSLEITYDGDENIINGWIIADKCGLFIKHIAERIPKDGYKLTFSSIREKDIDSVPIKLVNNKLVAVYERLTEMYSMPRYDEIDPTPVMAMFYLLFFGMMVADFGYGLAVFLVGFVIKKFLKVKRSTKNFVDFLFYLSFPIMGWGLIFGSFFGIEMPFGLISTTVDLILMSILSIVLGFAHIMAGLVMHMINQIKLKNYFSMISGGLSWFLTFLGGAFMILSEMTPWFSGNALFYTGAAITGTGVILTIFVPAIQFGRRWYAGIGKGLYALYGATGFLGDFVSYMRLMALGVAGGSVARAFNTILSFMPLPAMLTIGLVLAVILHLLNIFLSVLSAYIHGIRLAFIEFFSKFYTGGGRKFEPFKAAEKNVIITDSKNE